MDLALLLKSEIQAQAQLRMKAGTKTDHVQKLAQGKTRDEVAKLAGVSHGTLDKYEHIKDTATPELVAAVQEGKVSIHAATQQAIRDEANRKRSEATKAQPRNDDGTMAEKEPVLDHTVQVPATDEPKSRNAAAAASKTNPGAVARGDKLAKDRPDLAEKVREPC